MTTGNNESKPTGAAALVGHFFLGDIDARRKGHQGQVVAYLVNGAYLVQFYSWFSGTPTNMGVVDLTNMSGLDFFENQEDWRYAGNRLSRKNKAESDASEGAP